MLKAVEAVHNGMNKMLASREFGVPRSTLIRKLSGNVSLQRKMCPPTELTKEENIFVDWILAMAFQCTNSILKDKFHKTTLEAVTGHRLRPGLVRTA
jgi:hypothetical protein